VRGDLTTLAQVKQFLGESGTATDNLLSSLISSASSFALTFLARDIFKNDYTETRNGIGSFSIRTLQYPINSVSLVSVNGITIPARPNVTGCGYSFDSGLIYLSGYEFCRGAQNITLGYNAGIATQSGSPLVPSGVPADLAQAVVDMVAVKYKRRTTIDVVGETIAQQTLTYAPSDITPSVQKVLNQYKRTFPVMP